jgi:phosphoribosylformimino-5-aminoimidazole carboxamide ribotide isomerase
MPRRIPRWRGYPVARGMFRRMFVIPRIELRDGAAVRPAAASTGAAPGTANDGERSPARENAFELVRAWSAAGFHRIHVADLDALASAGANETLLDALLRDGGCELQVETRADSSDDIQRLLDAGAAQVVLGPRAMDDDSWLATAAELFPGSLIVATGVRQRRVVKRGWVRTLPLDIFDFLDELASLPLGGLLVSSAGQRGTLDASDLSLLEDIAEAASLPLITRDGVFDTSDLRALEHRGVSAAVVGEPLYSGVLDGWSVAQEWGAL